MWQSENQTGEMPVPGGNFALVLNTVGTSTLYAKWLAGDGTQLATNQVNLVCVSTEPAPVRLRLVGNPALANVLRDQGYAVSEGDPSSARADEIVIARSYTSVLQAYVQGGGRLLLLADPADSQGSAESIALPVGFVLPRAGSVWQGDWANSIAWVKKQGPLAHLPGAPLLEMEWANIMPDSVLIGLPTWAYLNHSWAGLALGWLHRAVSLLTVMPYGRGHILITTFRLNATTLAGDAIAQALFAGMLNLL